MEGGNKRVFPSNHKHFNKCSEALFKVVNVFFYFLFQLSRENLSTLSESVSSDSDPLARGPIADNLSDLSSSGLNSPETPPVKKRYVKT